MLDCVFWNDMPVACATCGDVLDPDAVRYERHAESGVVDRFCSLNCLAGATDYDESAVHDRLFEGDSSA